MKGRAPVRIGLAMAVTLAACTADSRDDSVVASPADRLPVWTLVGPDLELGEFEGGGDQTFDLVSGAAMLGPDRVAVLDQGAATGFIYDEAGTLIGTFGGEGDGPGEFRAPADMRVLEGDSVRVFDARDMSVTLLSPDLGYVREFPSANPLAERFLLDGEVTEDERAAALAVVRRRPFPVDRPGFRLATLADDGRVWVRERVGTDDTPALWVVLDIDGTPMRAIEVPHRFRAMFMRDDEVLGRWRGDFDVHYVRRYRLESGGRTVAMPDWLAEPVPATPAPPMPDSILRGTSR